MADVPPLKALLEIRSVDGAEALRLVPQLAQLLIHCVEGGASVNFVRPMTMEKATSFWRAVAADVTRGGRVLLVALDDNGNPLGTVQLVFALPENQPHRADVAKMLVAPHARRRGIARKLLTALDDTARETGRTVLVLDTETGSDAERLYASAGWERVGDIPGYALTPDGAPCSATWFYRHVPAHITT